jgi:hypothetical protein
LLLSARSHSISGSYHLFVASFSPGWRKTGNKENTLLPQAMRDLEVDTTQLLSLRRAMIPQAERGSIHIIY